MFFDFQNGHFLIVFLPVLAKNDLFFGYINPRFLQKTVSKKKWYPLFFKNRKKSEKRPLFWPFLAIFEGVFCPLFTHFCLVPIIRYAFGYNLSTNFIHQKMTIKIGVYPFLPSFLAKMAIFDHFLLFLVDFFFSLFDNLQPFTRNFLYTKSCFFRLFWPKNTEKTRFLGKKHRFLAIFGHFWGHFLTHFFTVFDGKKSCIDLWICASITFFRYWKKCSKNGFPKNDPFFALFYHFLTLFLTLFCANLGPICPKLTPKLSTF